MWRWNYLFVGLAIGSICQSPARAEGLSAYPSVRMLYDTNVLRTNRQRSGLTDDDLRVTPGLVIAYGKALGIGTLTAKAEIGYDWHSRYEFLNRLRIESELGGRFRVLPTCFIDPKVTIGYGQSDLAELGSTVSNGVLAQVYSASLDCPGPVGIVPYVSGSYSRQDNSRATQERFDRRSIDAAVGFAYLRPSLGRLLIYGAYGSSERPKVFDIAGQQDLTRTYRAGAEFSRAVSHFVQMKAGAKYLEVHARSGLIADRRYTGYGWDGSVTITPSPRLRFSLNTQRDAGSQYALGAGYSISESYGASAGLSFSRSSLSLSYSHQDRRFFGEDPLVILRPRIADEADTINLGYGYRVSKTLNVNGNVGYRRRDGRDSFYDYDSLYFGLSVGGAL
jgi:hypothetical protein